jgi:hypothetical protein
MGEDNRSSDYAKIIPRLQILTKVIFANPYLVLGQPALHQRRLHTTLEPQHRLDREPGNPVPTQHDGDYKGLGRLGCGLVEHAAGRGEGVAHGLGVRSAQQKSEDGGRARTQTVTSHCEIVIIVIREGLV